MSEHVLAIDLETTDTLSGDPSIIEIGAAHYKDNKLISEFSIKIRSDYNKEVSLGALKVNKVRYSNLFNYNYKSIEEACKNFIIWLTHNVFSSLKEYESIKILGKGVHFDIQLLKAALKDYKIIGWVDAFGHRAIDISVIIDFLKKINILPRDVSSLSSIANYLNIPVEENLLHTALYDAKISAQVYFELLKLMENYNGKSK